MMLQTRKDIVEDLAPSDVKEIKCFPISIDEEWKPILLKELLKLANGSLVVDGFTTEEISQMIHDLCVN